MSFMNKRGVGVGMIKAAIVGLIFLTVLLSILPDLIHTSAESVQTLSTELSNSTIYGSGAANIGSNLSTWTGYFWVIGPLLLIITIVLGLFMRKR